jgi:hypothetical protein
MAKFQELIEQSKGEKEPSMRLILLVGVWYAAIGYYLFRYLSMRNTVKLLEVEPQAPSDFQSTPPPQGHPPRLTHSRAGKRHRLVGFLGYFVFIGWAVFGLFVALSFLSSKIRLPQPVADDLVIYPLCMLLITGLFALLRFLGGKP